MAGGKKMESEPFHAPFKSLEGLLPRLHNPGKAQEKIKSDCPSEEQLFKEAMRDVKPLDFSRERYVCLDPLPVKRNWCSCPEPVEAITELVNLVRGLSDFDVFQSDEYVQWIAPDLHPEILEQLRRGGFPVQAHLDLHRMTVEEAQAAVSRFIWKSYADGLSCVLVIHGKGLNSANKTPVLKKHLVNWLRRGPLRKVVKAYASARHHDGGLGALYVLLEPSRRYLARSGGSKTLDRRRQRNS
jgi:DNA-nicking Smr family endonuclease